MSATKKNVSDFVQKHFVSASNVSQFAQPKKHHGQQCVRNNVSSFTSFSPLAENLLSDVSYCSRNYVTEKITSVNVTD